MTAHPFDWAKTLKKYGNNEKIAAEVTAMFFAELPAVHTAVNAAFTQKEIQKLYGALHKLHGSCCFVAVSDFKTVVRKFCDVTHHGKKEDIENLKFLLDDFNLLYDSLMAYQKDFDPNASA